MAVVWEAAEGTPVARESATLPPLGYDLMKRCRGDKAWRYVETFPADPLRLDLRSGETLLLGVAYTHPPLGCELAVYTLNRDGSRPMSPASALFGIEQVRRWRLAHGVFDAR